MQRNHGPGGLRRRALTASDPARLDIGATVLAPSPVLVLDRFDPGDSATDTWVVGPHAGGPQSTERQLSSKALGVVGIECCPPPVAALHRNHPLDSSRGGPLDAPRIGMRDAPERQDTDRGVVDVRIVDVVIFERPPPGPCIWPP